MNPKPLFLAAVCLLPWEDETVCVHPPAGDAARISLKAVREAQEAVKSRLAFASEKAGRLSLDTPFDSGLPSCRRRETRVVRTSVPQDLAGKTILFAPADRLAKADLRVATSARRISEIDADGLASPALAGRLGVRCAPTLVRVKSEVELELVEDP